MWTRPILKELGFEYTSNGFDDDLPYLDRAANLLVVPYSLDTNDTKFIRPNGFIITDEFLTYVRESLEVLIEEGKAGAPKMLNIGFHLRISGRAGRIRALTKVLDLLDSLGSSSLGGASNRHRPLLDARRAALRSQGQKAETRPAPPDRALQLRLDRTRRRINTRPSHLQAARNQTSW